MTLTTTSDIVVNVVVVDDHLSPFDRVIAALRTRGRRVQVKADGQRARAQCPCPGHADRRESLSVTWRNSVVLLNCFAGCRKNDILAALGLQSRDLFSGPSTLRTRQDDPIAVVYQYVDVRTGVQVEKVRTISKRFFWRHADATARGGYRAGLDGSEPGLYRGEHLIGLKHVLVCEGEKASGGSPDRDSPHWVVRFLSDPEPVHENHEFAGDRYDGSLLRILPATAR